MEAEAGNHIQEAPVSPTSPTYLAPGANPLQNGVEKSFKLRRSFSK